MKSAFALGVVLVGAAGCAFDGAIPLQIRGASPVVVTESSNPEQTPRRLAGVTARKGRVVRIDCTVTLVYDVREATGTAVLAQTYVLHLRTRRLPRRTAYEFDCMGPLIVELPADTSNIEATSTGASAANVTTLPVKAAVTSVPLAFGKLLRAEPGTQFAIVEWPPTLPGGDYRAELSFSLPDGRAFREKALVTASISCGRSSYLQPILPQVTTMGRAPAFTIDPTANQVMVSLPHIAGASGIYAEAKRTLSCTR